MATQGVALWSTTAATNATADPAGQFPEGMAPSAVNDGVRGLMSSVAKWRDDLYGLTTAGTATAFTVTTNATYATAAAMSGAVFTIIPDNTSGAAPTLAVDGLTARALNVSTGVAIPTGALVAGTPYLVKYVHATTEFIVLGVVGKSLLSALDIINGTSEATIATDDTLPIYDFSATANRRMLVSDLLKVVNALTADGSPDSAADYVMTYDTSDSAAKKVLLQNLPGRLPRGYIDGCILANGTDATNDINVAAGVCRDSTNAVDITVAAMTKQLDANWAAGTAAGMRDSAAGITDTTYHIYAVAKADGTQDIYAHTSATVATVLTALQAETGGADYIYARLVGSIIRASSVIRPFIQRADGYIEYTIPVVDYTTSSSGTSAVTVTLASIPSGISVRALLNYAGTSAYVFSTAASDGVPSSSSAPLGSVFDPSTVSGGQVIVHTNTSAQIKYHPGADSNVAIAPIGYWHPRGQGA